MPLRVTVAPRSLREERVSRPFHGVAAPSLAAVGQDRVAVPLVVKEPHIAGPKTAKTPKERHRDGQDHPERQRQPSRKVADAEIHFTDGPLAGLKLIGFSVWEVKRGGGRNVTFPAHQYNVNGERRSFALLRPIIDATGQVSLLDLILAAYAEWERDASRSSAPIGSDT